MSKRKTIGLLINDIDGNYQTFLWLKMKEAAEKFDCNLVVYEGRSLGYLNSADRHHHIIYEFVSRSRLDGLIVTSASLASHISDHDYGEFWKNLKNIIQDMPVVSLGKKMPEASNLLFENKEGLKSLLRHLIKDHGYTKIAFVTGPLSSVESNLRFDAFKEAMEENDIAIDDRLVFYGDFFSHTGYDIMNEILMKDIEYDAIVYSNDDMALGAVKCVKDMARHKMMDLSKKLTICGFDDTFNAALITPALTTVRQPIEEICFSAVEIILKQLNGEKVEEEISFPSIPVIRQSCGCSQESAANNKESDSCLRLLPGFRIHENLQTYSLERLFDSITLSLPLCYVRSCFISTYLSGSVIYDANSFAGNSFLLPEKSELIYAYYDNKRMGVDNSIRCFETKDMVPSCFVPEHRRFTYLANPLFFNNEHFGFVVFEVDNNDVINFEPLRGQISNTLKGALMLLEREKMEKSLLESERLASLGQLIGGISHNLMTPIMSISGACAGLEDLIKEYIESIGDSKVTQQDHLEIADDMSVWIERLTEYNSYMSNVIKTVKTQAVRLNADVSERFTIEELISQIRFMIKNNIKYKNVDINIDLQVKPDEALTGNIANLVQIFDNLIFNAVQSYEETECESRTVDFIVKNKDDSIVFVVKDCGIGIKDEARSKIFKHMVTTKGKNGTGLSLMLSYSTIKGKFRGDIWFESEQGSGTCFYVVVPQN